MQNSSIIVQDSITIVQEDLAQIIEESVTTIKEVSAFGGNFCGDESSGSLLEENTGKDMDNLLENSGTKLCEVGPFGLVESTLVGDTRVVGHLCNSAGVSLPKLKEEGQEDGEVKGGVVERIHECPRIDGEIQGDIREEGGIHGEELENVV